MEVIEGNAELTQQEKVVQAQANLIRAWAGQHLIMRLIEHFADCCLAVHLNALVAARQPALKIRAAAYERLKHSTYL